MCPRLNFLPTTSSSRTITSNFCPAESEIVDIVDKIIVNLNASGMKDMGKVMSLASQEMMGKADGKTISSIVKSKLSL